MYACTENTFWNCYWWTLGLRRRVTSGYVRMYRSHFLELLLVDLKTQEESNQRVCMYLLETYIGTVIGEPEDSGGE